MDVRVSAVVAAGLLGFGALSGCGTEDPGEAGEPAATVTVTETAEPDDPGTDGETKERGNTDGGNVAGAGLRNGVCAGPVGKKRVDGDVVVRSGASCVLGGTMIDGNVEVRGGAELQAVNVQVGGDVQGEAHSKLTVRDSFVDGNVQLEHGGAATVVNSRIGGDLQSEQNRGAQRFRGNTIDGNLQCESNSPTPVGSGNRVDGDKEGQCRGL